MQILFWVDPLIEFGEPARKRPWLTPFSSELIAALRDGGDSRSLRIAVATNELLADDPAMPDDVEVVRFTQAELIAPFGRENALELSLAWYRRTLAPEQLDAYARLIRERLNGFVPDLVVTHGPSPHLRAAFPDATILHREYGPFSRAPFAESWYFDPHGMYANSLLSRHADRLCDTAIAPDSLAALDRFRDDARRLLLGRSPFAALVDELRGRFRHLLLLPLGYSGIYSMDGVFEIRSQYETLVHVLDLVPAEVAVIVTTHPDASVLSTEAIEFLRARHANLIHDDRFELTYAASQYLLPAVDGVAAVSSQLGFQALFWRKHLFPLGSYFGRFAGHRGLGEVTRSLSTAAPERDGLIHWILSRYAVPRRQLHDPDWARAFVARSIERWRQGAHGPEFFDPIADDEDLFGGLSEDLDRSEPRRGNRPSYRRLERRARTLAGHHGELLRDLEIAIDPAAAVDHAIGTAVTRARLATERGRGLQASLRLHELRERIEGGYAAVIQALDQASAPPPASEGRCAAPSSPGSEFDYRSLIRRARREPLDDVLDALSRALREHVPAEPFRPAERYCLLLAADLDAVHDAWPRWLRLFRRLMVPGYCLGDPRGLPLTTVGDVGGPPLDDGRALDTLGAAELVLAQDPLSASIAATLGLRAVIVGDRGWIPGADPRTIRVVNVPRAGIDQVSEDALMTTIGRLAPELV